MKKFSLTILIVAATLLAFVGCKKDEPEPPTPPPTTNNGEEPTNSNTSGIYNPEKKIGKIFMENRTTDGKKLAQTWTWDGDLLSKITYGEDTFHDNGDFQLFEYDGKRLKTIRYNSWGRLEFTYDGKKTLKECSEYTSGGELSATHKFEHDGNKISKITIITYGVEEDLYALNEHSPLNYLVPQRFLAKVADNQPLTKATKKNDTYVITFEWDGDNITKAITKMPNNDSFYTVTMRFTYDSKSNPFYYAPLYSPIQSWRLLYSNPALGLSKNNVTKISLTLKDGGNEDNFEMDYSYTYDGKFPTEISGSTEGYFEIVSLEYQ